MRRSLCYKCWKDLWRNWEDDDDSDDSFPAHVLEAAFSFVPLTKFPSAGEAPAVETLAVGDPVLSNLLS